MKLAAFSTFLSVEITGGGRVGGGSAVTEMVVVAVAVPPGPVAVSVYTVVAVGANCTMPAAGTAPTPWSMETMVVCPSTRHCRVEDWPRWMEFGCAVNCAIVGATGGVGVGDGLGAGDGLGDGGEEA